MQSIQSTLGDSISASLAAGLSSINAVIADLQAQVDSIASSEQADTISSTLGDVQDTLDELLASNNVFSGDLTINSVPTLEFASNLGDKVNIVNGNVFIEQNADMDPAVLQEVCDRLMTITGNINVRAQTSSAPAVQFPNLTGVTNVVIAQAGSISFPVLLSSSKIVLGDNYSSRVDGVIDFSALTRVNSISTAIVNVGWALASEALNTISFSKASNINFAALPYYSPRTLSIVGDQNTDLNLASLENKDANGNARDYTLNIDGAAELNVPGVLDGKITVTDVVNVILPEYVGEITVNSGVEILTMGKLSENLTATGNDLITVDITSASAGVEINFTGATALTDAKIAGKLKTATFSGNADLTSLIISAELINLTINNTALAEASLDHTNGDLAKGGSLVVTNNEDLVTLAASKIDGLKTLTITSNDELESISFDSLAATPTDGSGVSVTIGGSAANANALNAFDILQENATDGTFNSGDSGLDSLKAFLTAAAAINASTLTVYFDSADTYTSAAGVTTNNLTIAANAGNLVVVNKDASTGDSGAKRSWVITIPGTVGAAYSLTANGATIMFNQEATKESTVAGILTAANINNFDINGVTLTANANASPQATLTLGKAAGAPISATATSTASANSVSLSIGDYSAKIYLVATLDAGFTAKPISASNKAAENQFVVNGSTTVSNVLTALANEFNNPSTISPYSVAVPATGAASQTATIISQDWSDAHTGKAVKFTQTSSSGATTHLGALQINTVVGSDDVLQGTDVQVTLTSKVPGETLSTIGNPPNGLSFTATVTAAAGVAGFSAVASGGSIAELGAYSTVTTLAGTTYTKSNFDSGSATNVGLNGTMGANLNRIPWL